MTKEELVQLIHDDRVFAHDFLFAHRHPDLTPQFHTTLIEHLHSSTSVYLFLCFRGSAKSTLSEEAFIIAAILGEFRNGLVLGENETRAAERLAAIAFELETNELIFTLFGETKGKTWGATKIVLANGVCVQAVGSGQSLRGIKHLDQRPDRVLVDDVEGEADVATPLQREKTRKWFFAVVLPALDARAIIRMTATPQDAEALPLILEASGWPTIRIPIKYIDPDTGEWLSSWPARYDMEWINKTEEAYLATGSGTEFNREYMCEAVLEKEKAFKQEMFKSLAAFRLPYTPVYAMYDPARTTNRQTSAHTGKAVWSWEKNRLLIWESGGYFWLPDELVADIFETNEKYRPISIRVEQDGLHEFLMQPIRQEQLNRGVLLPVLPIKAPKGKLDFIKALQPFFKAGEVIFIGDSHDELKKQLLSFPTGRIDVPNALAYALLLKPGAPIYSTFGESAIILDDMRFPKSDLWAVYNSDGLFTSASLVQYIRGKLVILADYIEEGPVGDGIDKLTRAIALEAGGRYRAICPAEHFRPHDTKGLRPALQRFRVQPERGGEQPSVGAELIRSLIDQGNLFVKHKASWTLKGFMGGYCLPIEAGPYKVVMEGLESFAARLTSLPPDDKDMNWDFTRDGRRFISAMP